METPSSTRRITRSQAKSQVMASFNIGDDNEIKAFPFAGGKVVECETDKGISKSRTRNSKKQQIQEDRSALIDITNDSPIVGLATEILATPSSSVTTKQRKTKVIDVTPGSGEALLREQVETLLQSVEEETDTPQVFQESEKRVAQINNSDLESQKSLNRSLLKDFTEKSEINEDCDECEEGMGFLDEVCAGIANMSVNEKARHIKFVYNSDDEIVDKYEETFVRLKGLPTPKGKHLRFKSSDDEQ